MKKVLYSGCSYTKGSGFDNEDRSPYLWTNLLHENSFLSKYQPVNCSASGRSNAVIFSRTVEFLTNPDHSFEYAFVQWSSMPRYETHVGLELYDTNLVFMPNATMLDINTNEINYTKSYLENLSNRFTSLANDHYEILDLIRYVNALINVAKLTNTKIFFVNGLCPWDSQYFTRLDNVLPNEFTPFTKALLNIDNRDDDEIFKLYDKIHNEYVAAGTIQESYWLNLYNSMLDNRIDFNSDNVHPGAQSNQQYYKHFLGALDEKS